MTAPFDTSLLRRLADAGVEISARLQGVCERTDLTANDTWHSCDDFAGELTRILHQLKTVRILAWDTDVQQAIGSSRPPLSFQQARDANFLRMSGRDLATARALSRVVVEGACEV